jgi:hypothetical protein
MYYDRKDLHDKEVKIRLNAEQAKELKETAHLLGAQPAALARELLAEQLAKIRNELDHKRKSA